VKEDQKEHLQVEDGPSSPGSKPFWRTLPQRLGKVVPLEEPGMRDAHPLKDKVIGVIKDLDAQRLYTLFREIKAEAVKYGLRGRPGDMKKANLLKVRADVVDTMLKQRLTELFPELADAGEGNKLEICNGWIVVDLNGGGGLGAMIAKELGRRMGRGGRDLPFPLNMILGEGMPVPGMFGGDEEDLPGVFGLGLRRGPFGMMDLSGMGEEEPGGGRFPGEREL
jgi:hypothetical protein